MVSFILAMTLIEHKCVRFMCVVNFFMLLLLFFFCFYYIFYAC